MRTRTWLLLLGIGVAIGCDDPFDDADARFEPTAVSLLSTDSPFKDEDPSVIRASDGAMIVAYFSDRDDGAGDIYVTRATAGENWSEAARVTLDPGGDFYPTIFQDNAGTYHLVWHRWYAYFKGHIMHSTSKKPGTWSVADEESVTTDPDVDDWLPTPAIASDGTLFIYFVSEVRDAGNATSQLYVVSKGPSDTEWSAVDPVSDLNSDTEHDQLPFVARTGSGFTMVWVRHDTTEPLPYRNPKSQLFLSTSADGRAWTSPQQVTNDAGNVVNLFPMIYSTGAGQSILWLSTRLGTPRPYEILVANADQYPLGVIDNTSLPDGYSHRVAATPTSGVFLGVWVVGPVGTENVFYRFYRK